MQQNRYADITASVKPEMERFEKELEALVLDNRNELCKDILEFLKAPSKRIRPVLMFLTLKALAAEISDEHYKVALATELLHSATLIHDDIIDCASERRKKECLHKKFDTKLAVIAGDYFLSLALKTLAELEQPHIFKIFSGNVLKICSGEISQYFKRYKVPSIEEYLEKSKNKTALLFLCAVKSALTVSETESPMLEEFALNFGTAFQIANDLKSDTDSDNGIYTLPYVLYFQNNPAYDIMNLDVNSYTEAKSLARSFLNEFIDGIMRDISSPDNKALMALCESLKEK